MLKFNILKKTEAKLEKKLDFFGLIRRLNQYDLVKKFILNENQTFMLNNQELPLVVLKKYQVDGDLQIIENEINDEKMKLANKELQEFKKLELKNYIKMKKAGNSLSDIDQMRFYFLEDEMEGRIEKQL